MTSWFHFGKVTWISIAEDSYLSINEHIYTIRDFPNLTKEEREELKYHFEQILKILWKFLKKAKIGYEETEVSPAKRSPACFSYCPSQPASFVGDKFTARSGYQYFLDEMSTLHTTTRQKEIVDSLQILASLVIDWIEAL